VRGVGSFVGFLSGQNLRFGAFESISELEGLPNHTQAKKNFLCNGWEHYVPYRCL
jgi:hypothetical protein